MATLRIQREREGRQVTLRLEGTFDGSAAKTLRTLLDELKTDEVVVDFSRVREFFDLALGTLSTAVAEGKVQLRGLRTHQERMFRYLGARPWTPVEGSGAYYTPEDTISA